MLDPLTISALVTGGATLIGGERTNRKSESASKHQYQRAVTDLRRAGLNPLLVGKFGGAPMPLYRNTLGDAAAAGNQMAQTASNVSLQSTQSMLNDETRRKVQEEVALVSARKGLTDAQTKQVGELTNLAVQQTLQAMSRTEGQDQVNTIRGVMTSLVESGAFSKIAGDVGSGIASVYDGTIESLEAIFGEDLAGAGLGAAALLFPALRLFKGAKRLKGGAKTNKPWSFKLKPIPEQQIRTPRRGGRPKYEWRR